MIESPRLRNKDSPYGNNMEGKSEILILDYRKTVAFTKNATVFGYSVE
jgi:hypothetical protein